MNEMEQIFHSYGFKISKEDLIEFFKVVDIDRDSIF